MISPRKAKHLDVTTMFTFSHANTTLGQSERAYYLSYFIKASVSVTLGFITIARLYLLYSFSPSEARVVSMAFLKNYAFFFLILFPCFIHVVHALNYATFIPNSNFMLHWAYSNNKLVFNMTCNATGWCAVGFTENPGGGGMVNYDIAAGGVAANGTSYLEVSLYNVTGFSVVK